LPGQTGREAAVNRDVHQAERGDRLPLAFLHELEVFLLQVGDEPAVPVSDDGVDLDEVDLAAEGDRRALIRALRGRR
jgi:hypothetical protein